MIRWATPIAILAALALAAWATPRALVGKRPGDVGSLLTLTILATMGAKLAAESYRFSYLGGEDSPRQRHAKALAGPLAGWTTLRFVLGAFGGVILPLGGQLLSAGARNIPAATDPRPAALCACLAAACLVPGELLARRLERLAAKAADE